MQLGLGTVQFGLNYGISNARGRTSYKEVRRILAHAAIHGIKVVDTAAAYGGSESVLGRSWPEQAELRVITKTMPLPKTIGQCQASAWVLDEFNRSLARLRLEAVDTLLVHHASDLLGPCGNAIYKSLIDLKCRGKVKKIGLSAYSGAEIDAALSCYDIDLIQVPVNVLDQRLLHGGQLQRIRNRKVEIHLRSVFLQGLLLMELDSVPNFFAPIRQHLVKWRRVLQDHGLTPVQGALAFVRTLNVDVVLIGVESVNQLQSNISDFSRANISDIDFNVFALVDEKFLNPSSWRI